MQSTKRSLLQALVSPLPRRALCPPSPAPPSSIATLARGAAIPRGATASCRNLLLRSPPVATPWSSVQRRGAKVLGSDVRLGNVVQRKGRIFQVLKAQHTQHGRGGATIQVELRDVDTGSKITERFRTDEAIERVFVEDRSFTFLYQEGDLVTLMEPGTYEQIELSKEMFGKAAGYLKEDMTVTVQFYDEKPMFASVPIRVNCIVVEAQPPTKGLTAAPQYKRAVLDNGLTVQVPPFIVIGDEIVVNTTDDSYITRARE